MVSKATVDDLPKRETNFRRCLISQNTKERKINKIFVFLNKQWIETLEVSVGNKNPPKA